MHATLQSPPAPHPPLATAPGAARHDLYASIHRALRLMMGDTLGRLGRLDPDDDDEVGDVSARVAQLLATCRSHLEHEDAFIHPALEARRPGASANASDAHAGHGQAIAALEAGLATLRAAPNALAVQRLYRQLAAFVAENLEHMEHEEQVHNTVLWQAYSDDELRAIEQALVASLPPEELMFVLEWMLRALPPAERAARLRALQAKLPPEPFRHVLALAQRVLEARDWHKLAAALGLKG